MLVRPLFLCRCTQRRTNTSNHSEQRTTDTQRHVKKNTQPDKQKVQHPVCGITLQQATEAAWLNLCSSACRRSWECCLLKRSGSTGSQLWHLGAASAQCLLKKTTARNPSFLGCTKKTCVKFSPRLCLLKLSRQRHGCPGDRKSHERTPDISHDPQWEAHHHWLRCLFEHKGGVTVSVVSCVFDIAITFAIGKTPNPGLVRILDFEYPV